MGQVESSQVESSQVESSQVESSQDLIIKIGKTVFKIDKNVAKLSGFLAQFLETDEPVILDDKLVNEITIDKVTFEKVIEFLNYHYKKPMKTIKRPLKLLKLNSFEKIVDKWDADFINVDNDMLLKLVNAANFLNIPSLLELCCAKIAYIIEEKGIKIISGRDPDQFQFWKLSDEIYLEVVRFLHKDFKRGEGYDEYVIKEDNILKTKKGPKCYFISSLPRAAEDVYNVPFLIISGKEKKDNDIFVNLADKNIQIGYFHDILDPEVRWIIIVNHFAKKFLYISISENDRINKKTWYQTLNVLQISRVLRSRIIDLPGIANLGDYKWLDINEFSEINEGISSYIKFIKLHPKRRFGSKKRRNSRKSRKSRKLT